MASREARALLRWTIEATRPELRWTSTSRGLNADPLPPSPLQMAKADAAVQLGISLVPGAASLLRLTELDLANRYVEAEYGSGGMGPIIGENHETILAARDKRMYERIRDWGLDPEAITPYIEADIDEASNDLSRYLAAAWQSARPSS
jgi:hypothetical protein